MTTTTTEPRMHPELAKFLRANGLPEDATEHEAWEYHRQLAAEGTAFNGPLTAEPPSGHAERSEASPAGGEEILRRFAPQNDEGGSEKKFSAADVRAEIRRLMAEEHKRAEDIRDAAAIAGLPDETVASLIESGATVETARAAAFVHLRSKNPAFGAAATSGIELGVEDGEKFRAAAIDGILMQRQVPLFEKIMFGGSVHRLREPAPGANEFRNFSPLMLARHCLERAGVRTVNMTPSQLAKRALISHSTSDFPMLLGGIGTESLRVGYKLAEPTWKPMATTTNAKDFRDMYTYSFAADLRLLPLNENGEYENADAVESGEKYRIARFGRVFNYTFEMLVNDRWDVFSDIPRGFGFEAGLLESEKVYGMITGNQKLSDGKPVFDASRGNIMTGSAFAQDSLDEAIQMLRAQTNEHGRLLDLQPAFLLVSPKDHVAARILMNSTGNTELERNSGVINPFQGVAQIICDQRVARGSWYLLAAPMVAPIFQAAWLDGESGPHIEEETDFLTDGVRIKARHCFGCGLVGWRGAVFNPGPTAP